MWQTAHRQPIWHGFSVRTQLLVAFILIDVVAVLVAGSVTIVTARTSTRVEIAASTGLAELLVSEAVALMQQEVPAEKFLADLSSHLRLVRHVRIVVKDAAGQPLSTGPQPGRAGASRAQDHAPAPAWFAALIASPVERRTVPVVVNARPIGSVEIAGEPKDEIGEVWENSVALGTALLALNVAVIAILYYLFGRVLDPLRGLAQGLAELERRNYRVRLSQPPAADLTVITDRFNALAEALEATRAENLRLNQRLITAQDDERRHTALELHDEVGPSLFGLKANAASIEAMACELPDQANRVVRERVRDMLAIIEQLQMMNRSLLKRLRPMALGHVPLQDLLAELVRERARQHPQIALSFSADELMRSYGDSLDLTIYRCVQESLTNAIRHAQPKHVVVELADAADPAGGGDRVLKLTVRDDGRGIDPKMPLGFGIRGMQERVQALGGSYGVETADGHGTRVSCAIPVPRLQESSEGLASSIGRAS